MRIESRTTARTRRRSTCCRRSGSATRGRGTPARTRPRIERDGAALRRGRPRASPATGSRRRPAPTARRPRRCSARTRPTRRASSAPTPTTPYPKDGINDHVVSGAATVNPDGFGTKAALRYRRDRPGRRHGRAAAAAAPARTRRRRPSRDWAGERVRRRSSPPARPTPTSSTPRSRRPDTDAEQHAGAAPGVRRAGVEQADVPLRRRPLARRRPGRAAAARGAPARPQRGWRHLDSFDVLAMPDPWEYPWFAAWDLGFHARRLGAPRPGVREVPAARAAARVVPAPERRAARLRVELRRRQPAGARDGRAARVPRSTAARDREFLERVFQKLLINFTWWLNREDADGNNVFGGGFLGLDNISPIDRSNLPDGRHARAGRRHGVDGLLRAVDARASRSSSPRRTTSTRHGRQVPRAVRPDRAGAGAARGSTTPRTASSTTASSYPSGESTPVKVQTIAGPPPAAARRRRCPAQVVRARRPARQALRAAPRRLGRRRGGRSASAASASSATSRPCSSR